MITRREVNTALLSGVVLATAPGLAQAQAPVNLPPPQTEGGLPLMQAFKKRRSSREFSERPPARAGPVKSAVGRLGDQSAAERIADRTKLAHDLGYRSLSRHGGRCLDLRSEGAPNRSAYAR